MSTNTTTPRIPKLGDMVQFGMETLGSMAGAAQLPPTPYPAIVLAVHDPSDPESLLDVAVIGPFGSGVSIQRSANYTPTLGIGTWSWIG